MGWDHWTTARLDHRSESGANNVKTGRIKLGENSEHSVKVWWSIMFKVRSAKGEPDDVKEVSHRLAQAAAPGNEVFTWCLANMLVMEKFRWGNHPKRTAACQKVNGKGGYLLTLSLLSKRQSTCPSYQPHKTFGCNDNQQKSQGINFRSREDWAEVF